MDRGAGADRSADGRQFHPPSESGRRKTPPGQYPLGPRGVRRRGRRGRGACALRRRGFPRRYGAGRRTDRSGADRSRFRAAPRTDHLRMDARPGQHPAHAGRSRQHPAEPDAGGDRGFRHARFEPSAGLLRHTALRPASGAHRRAGRLVHRRRHPHGRPARKAPAGLRRRRRRLRADGLAPDGVPPHDQNPVERLDLLQHHAAQGRAAEPARELLRFGLGLPACGRRFDPLGKYRLPQAARHLHRGAGLLHQPRRKPRGADAQRLAAP